MPGERPDKDGYYPCPASWFSRIARLSVEAEVLRMGVISTYYAPLHWRLAAQNYKSILEAAKPGLEKIAEQRYRAKLKERRFLGL